MNICEKCNRQHRDTITAIIDGTFYEHLCLSCKYALTAGQSPSSGHADWSRQRDLEDHEGDIQQPWNSDGSPNEKFMRLYPDLAKTHFSDEQMRRTMRN